MGLNKVHTLRTGVKVTYWNIGDIKLSKKRGYTDVKLHGYITKKAHTDGLDEVTTRSVRISWEEFESGLSVEKMNKQGSNIYSLAYEYAKTQDSFFSGSQDVLENNQKAVDPVADTGTETTTQ